MKLYAIFAVLALTCFVYNTQAFTFFKLEQFLEAKEAFLLVPNQIPTAYDWWTPYYAGNPTHGPPPAIEFMTASGALGGETDLVIGYESSSDPGVSAVLNSRRTGGGVGGCFYTLGFVGGGFWQWDGPDQSAQYPGRANPVPGIGSSTTYAYLPDMQADGQNIDLTLRGRVTEFNWQAQTDLDCEYEWDFFDRNNASTKYTIPIPAIDTFATFRINYASTPFSRRDAGWRGFTSIAAIQLTVYTFFSATNAIDTEFKELNFVGYQAQAFVKNDCDCDITNATPGTFVQGASLTLRSGTGTTPTGTVLQTVTTDVGGRAQFFGMAAGTYQICIASPIPASAQLCAAETVCRAVIFTNLVDPVDIYFTVVQPPTLSPPANAAIQCGACTLATVACTGFATLNSCGSGSSPVTTFEDSVNTVGCVVTRTRSFTSGSLRATQTITISDTQSPVLVTPASNSEVQCNSQIPSFATFLSTYGGATWTDCTSFTVVANTTTGPNGCGSTVVRFTATDPCAGTSPVSTTATYSIMDGINPGFSPAASDSSAACNQNGSDLQAFNTWLSNNAGARASDNCGSPAVTNDYSSLPPLTRGCSSSVTVTFTATDGCGLTARTTATFLITDSTGPSITTAAGTRTDTCDSGTNQRFAAWRNNHGDAVASDVCSNVNQLTWTDSFIGTTLPLSCSSDTTVTFTVYDPCGRNSTTTGTYRISDTTAPRFTAQPTALDVACDAGNANTVISAWLAANGNAQAVDDCTGSVAWSNNYDAVENDCGSNIVTFTACDLCESARCSTATALFTISDDEPPTYVTPPQSTTAPCNPNTQSVFDAWIQSGANAVLDDNCSDDSDIAFTNDNTSGFPFGCNAVRTVTFFAVDACRNSAPRRTATFTVTDSIPPVIQIVATSPTVECDNTINTQYNQWRSTHGGATATDECTNTVTWTDTGVASISAPTTGCTSSTVVTFTAFDQCANPVRTTGTFTVRDTTRPNITVQARSQTGECTSSGNQSAIQQWLSTNGGASATDACSAVTWANNFNGFSGGCTDAATVTFTVADVCGLTSTTVASFTVNDSAAPVINPQAQPLTSQCGPTTNSDFAAWVANHGGAVAVDACQTQASLIWSNDVGDVTFSTCGTRTVTFTVTDPCDRSASTTAVFTVSDQTAPAFNPQARDTTVECSRTGNQADYNTWLSTRAGAVATDACAIQITYTNNGPANGPVRCGAVTVTFTATDNCNNVGRTTATFTVADSAAPTFTQFPITRLVDCSDPATNSASLNSWLTNYAGAAAVDACSPSSELTYTSTPVDTLGDNCVRRQIYRFTITDTCGKSVSETAAFITTDIEDPVFTTEPRNATFVCDGNGNVNQITDWINSNGGGAARDECQANVVWTNNYRGVGPFTCTSNLVTFVVSDSCSNSIAKTVLLTITDDEPPVFSNVPGDITVQCDVDTHPQFLGYPSANDVCTGNPIVTFEDFESDDPPIGDCPGNHYILRTFSTFDECGNTATVDQLITVNLTRSGGPCDPSGCVCDDCCPEASPSNCLPSVCNATPCRATPCTASTCLCPVVAKAATAVQHAAADELPQCEPIYIHVHDDDDNTSAEKALREPKMLVTNRLVDFNKSDASVISFSVLIFFVLFFLF